MAATAPTSATQTRLVDALIDELRRFGVNHAFGIPGDYALGLFDALEASPIDLINTCDEQGAGFAADAYARVHGLGVVAITYGVGGLKLVNSTAQAYAERSPVVVISGTPGLAERAGNALLHHRVRDFETQLRVFEQVTVAQALLHNPDTAVSEIRRVLNTARRTRRPVYIELPRDRVAYPVEPVTAIVESVPATNQAGLAEALQEAIGMLNAAERPVILAGVEMHRFDLQSALLDLIGRARIPFATTIMGKSVVAEDQPGFIGVYAGGLCRDEVREAIEGADCLLLLGAMMTDLNTGIFSARLDPGRIIDATADVLSVRHHQYPGLDLPTFVAGLCRAPLRERPPLPPSSHHGPASFTPAPADAITVARLFECLDSRLTPETAVIADPGDALFGATDLTIHQSSEFIACAYYASLGFAVPASIGVELAKPGWRPLVLVGDGAFQMTGLELTTAARYGLTPIVVVLDNAGYGTERPMLDGRFNDVHAWRISQVPALIQAGRAFEVQTEADFVAAIDAAFATRELTLIHVHLAQDDRSPALNRLTRNLKERI